MTRISMECLTVLEAVKDRKAGAKPKNIAVSGLLFVENAKFGRQAKSYWIWNIETYFDAVRPVGGVEAFLW